MASRSLGTLTIDLIAKVGGFTQGIGSAERRLQGFQKSAEKYAKAAGLAIGTGVAAAVTAVTALTAKAINFADELNDISHKTGVSAETLSAWAYAAEQSGTSIDALSSALPKFSKNVSAAADETSKQSQLFKALGIDVKDAHGNLRKVEDLIPEVAERFKGLNNETTETALAMELFGKSGAELKQFLENGSDGLKSLMDRAAELGVVIGNDTVAAADEFKDKLSDLKAIALGFGVQLAENLLPDLINLTDRFSQLVKDGKEAGSAMEGLTTFLRTAGDVASFVSVYFKALDDVIVGATWGFQGFIEAAKGVINLDWDQFKRGMQLSAEGRDLAIFGRDATGNGAKPKAKTTVSTDDSTVDIMSRGIKEMLAAEGSKSGALQDRLNKFFATGGRTSAGGSSKSSRKSDAERDAERLLAMFERQKEAMDEQIALYGQTSRAAQVRYDVEHGELAKLTQAEKDELIVRAERLDMLDREKDMQERLDRETEAYEQMNDLILEQIGYLGMTADEQEIAVNLARAGVSVESERGRVIAENTRALQAQREAMSDQIEAMDAVRDAGKNFLYDWTSGSKSFKDSFLDALDSIHQTILKMIAENLMDKLFGKPGDPGGGVAGDWLGKLSGFIFGGGKAGGGPVQPWSMYEVNEQGMEGLSVGGRDYLLTGSRGGYITPANQMGGRNISQTFVVQGAPDRRTREQMARESGIAARRALVRT